MISAIFLRPRPLGHKLTFNSRHSYTYLTATQHVLEASGWRLPFPGWYSLSLTGGGGGGGGYGDVQRPQRGEAGRNGDLVTGATFLRDSIRAVWGRGGYGGGYNTYSPGNTGGSTEFVRLMALGGIGGRSGQQLAAQNIPENSYLTSGYEYLPGGGGDGGMAGNRAGGDGAAGQLVLILVG